jgi:autotransporter-associated beta strand protein
MAAALLALQFALSPADAAVVTWDNSGTTFSSGSSWVGDSAPPSSVTGDPTAAFGNVGAGNNNVNVSADRSVGGIAFDSGANAYTFTNFALTVGATNTAGGATGIVNNSTAVQTFSNKVLNSGSSPLWTSVSGGSLIFNGGIDLTTSGSGAGRTLTLGGAGTITVGSVIANGGTATAGAITVTSTGNTTLSGDNTYDGLTIVNAGAGTLTLSGNNSGAAGGVQVRTGTLNINNANALGSGTLELRSAAIINNTTGAALTNAGNNAITWGENTNSPGFTFGTASSTATNNLNLGSGTVTAATDRNMTILGTGVTLTMGNLDVTSTATSSDVALTATGAGNSLVFSNFNLRTAALAVATNSIKGSANWTFNGTIADGNAFANVVKVDSTGITTFNGSNSMTGLLRVLSGATLKLGHVFALGATNGATTVESGGTLDLNGQAIGAEAVSLSGTGVGSNGALYNGTASSSSLTGAVTLAANSTIKTVAGGSMALSGALDLNASSAVTRTLTIDGAGTTTLNGNISNSFAGSTGAISAAGTGRTILSGSNSYSGATTVNTNAILVASSSAALGATNTGTTVNDGGTLALQGGVTITNESVSITGQGAGGGGALRNLSGINTYGGGITFNTGTNRINSDAGTLTLTALATNLSSARQLVVGGAGNVVLAAALSGTSTNGTVTKEGAGTLTLANNNTYAGNTFVNGGTLLYGTNDALGAVAVTVDSGTMDIGAFSDTVGAIIVTNGGSILGSGGTLTGTSYSVASSTITANLAGSGGLTVNGTSSTAVLSGSNSYSGATQFGSVTNQTLRATTTNSLSANSTLEGSSSSANTPTVDLAAGGHTMKNYVGGNMIFLATNGAATLTFTNTGASNTIVGGSRTLTTTNVNLLFAGDLDISATGADKTMTFAGNGNVTVSGAITVTNTSFAATLRQNSSGTVILNGANTYNGGTSIGAGVLQIGNGGATGTLGGGVVTNNATLAFNRTGTLAVTNAIGGTGAVTKSGAGTVTLSGSNNYAGATTISNGTIELAGASGASAGSTTSVSIASGAKLLLSQSGQVNDAATVSLSGGTIERGSGVTETFGNLTLTANSFLDYGTGAIGTLTFGTYSPTLKLSVNNFLIGNVLRFTTDLSGSINNTSLFAFDNGFVSDWATTTPGFFTITAIPETSTVVAACGLLALCLWPLRRHCAAAAKGFLADA